MGDVPIVFLITFVELRKISSIFKMILRLHATDMEYNRIVFKAY